MRSAAGRAVHRVRRWSSLVATACLVASLAACGFPGLEPEPEPLPDGMPEAIGPVIEIGGAESLGIEWRYSIYESTEGWCTRVEMAASGAGATCGVLVNGQGAGPIRVSGVGTGSGMPSQVDGWVSEEVAEVWIETNVGAVPATVMPLDAAGMAGQLFFALVPGDRRMRAAVGVDAAGQELGRASIDAP